MITWLSTKSPIRMLDYQIDQATEQHLRDNVGVDSALLAADLGICTARVESHQRRLGLRAFAPCGQPPRG
jgi:hypothetical protein